VAPPVGLFLCGDVMLGRGVDQILPQPGDPTLRERAVRDARTYVELVERVSGPVPRPVDSSWPWGDALALLDTAAPAVRLVNLETTVTRSDRFAPGKAVHYRMNPANLPGLSIARPDVCVLANNHVLDFGRSGLVETLDALAGAGLRTAGAGRDAAQAWRPAVVPLDGAGRVLVVAFGFASSGIPPGWAATGDRAGVAFLGEPSDAVADAISAGLQETRRAGDLAVASVHWGPNWGYRVGRRETRFAHRLVEGGVDVVHGHSAHHPRPVEVYRGKLILYGCGDFIDDYEGITGYQEFRPDLRLGYLADVDADTGALHRLRMAALQARRMRLEAATPPDALWLSTTLDRVSRPFGSRIRLAPDGHLVLDGFDRQDLSPDPQLDRST
jgi:poly-gamma-glutamate capsule biosynthesis protein CapA/YwtB (metallophosphatase superfamily)